MTPSIESTVASGMTRREAIRRAAMAAGVVVSAEWLPVVDGARALAQSSRLTTAQAAMAGAIAERILPRTDTPGAADVGVPAFLELLYAEFMSPEEQQTMTTGLAAVDAAAKAAHGNGFASLSSAQQDAVLRGIAQEEQPREGGFFRLIRAATILGYFSSEPVGRNVLHFDPVPGRFDGCVPIDEVGRRNWTT